MRRFILLLLVVLPLALSCSKKGPAESGKVQVVATVFPVYDMARAIAADRVDVTLLLPPGVEPHSFEPRPEQLMRLRKAGLFIYTDASMEPWAASLIKGIENPKLRVVEAGKGVPRLPEQDGHRGEDPHIWLDFANAEKMVENIAAGLEAADPGNAAIYRENGEHYILALRGLDQRYREALAACPSKTVVHGGHSAFAYLAQRYGLRYVPAYPGASDAEPSPRQMAALVDTIRKNNLRYIFYEELVSPRVADVLAKETGAKPLLLNGAHNVSKDELQKKVTFLQLMEDNLKNLQTGLGCVQPQ